LRQVWRLISGARVTVISQASALTWTATTDTSGFYFVANLPVTIYNVEAEAVSFRKPKLGIENNRGHSSCLRGM
jgi:hypothetical protein